MTGLSPPELTCFMESDRIPLRQVQKFTGISNPRNSPLMMRGTTRDMVAVILLMVSSSLCEDLCSDEEVEVVKILGAALGVSSFTFIGNHENVGTLRKIGSFPKSFLYSAVVNSDQLDVILSDESRQNLFFEKRTVSVTKEKLNFTRTLEKERASNLGRKRARLRARNLFTECCLLKFSGLHSVSWVVFVESLDDINQFYIPINTNFFTVHCTTDAITINKTYNVKPGLRLSVKNLKIWSKEENERTLEIIRDNKISFENATLTMLYLFSEEECSAKSKHVLEKMECFHQEIMKIIAERLNTTLNKMACSDRQYPYNYPNGTLSEMFVTLSRREADVSSGSYIISNSRLMFFDFAWPVFSTRSMMYIKSERGKSSWRAYLRPVDEKVWMAIVSWVLLVGFLLQVFGELRQKHFKFRLALLSEMIRSVYLSLQVFCNQGLHSMPNWYSNRIVLMSTFLLFISLYQSYSGFLISSLTVTTPHIPFTDLEEFFQDGTYKIMTLKKGFHNYFIQKTMKEQGRGKHFFLDELDLPTTSKNGIDRLCTIEKLTYVEFRENMVQHEIPCEILEVPKPILQQTIGLGLPKNSPYKEIISRHVNVLRSTGILHRMRRYLLSYTTLHEKKTSTEQFIRVSTWHLVSLFFIMGVGTVISIIIFFIEIFLNCSNSHELSCSQIYPRKSIKAKEIN